MAATLLTGISAGAASAQRPPPPPPDSTRPVKLGDIVVRESAGDAARVTYSQRRISLAAIQQRDATVVSDLARLVPAAHVQTNSRGETLIYLRNAGERQVAVFFEGALLNVPWDNRVDLSVIPTSAVGGITVAQGVPPVEYGANVLGGAVNLTAHRPEGYWAESRVTTRYGSAGQFQASVSHARRTERFTYAAAAAFGSADGRRVPDGADLPFSQPAGELRTNTDFQIANLFASGVYEIGASSRIGLTVLHMDADKGVAPEGHLDPSQSNVRFWRYPEWRHTTAIIHGQGVGEGTSWRGAVWITSFDQQIESYGSARYNTVDQLQDDTDLTVGTRFVVSTTVGSGLAKLAVNGLTSTHRQRETQLDPAGGPATTSPRLSFQTHLTSLGGEYDVPVAELWRFSVGASLDAMFAPRTGDKPDQDPFVDYSVTAGITRPLSHHGFIRVSVGRKTRFPTMRELFGTALDRFLLNPDLQPESSFLAEVAFGLEGEKISGEIIPFGRFTSNTIDQVSVTLPGEIRPRRQRINLRGSEVIGVEFVGSAMPTDHLTLEGHFTVMHVGRRRDMPSDSPRISEKPTALGRLAAFYEWSSGTSAQVETVYTGRAYSPDDNNVFVPLDPALVFNLRVEQRVALTASRVIKVFARADNLTDATVLPQLGLPDAGRGVSGGLEFSF